MQNYILWWRKWQNEIRARTLDGMTVMEHFKSSKTHFSGYYCVHHKPHMVWPEVRPAQEGWLE